MKKDNKYLLWIILVMSAIVALMLDYILFLISVFAVSYAFFGNDTIDFFREFDWFWLSVEVWFLFYAIKTYFNFK